MEPLTDQAPFKHIMNSFFIINFIACCFIAALATNFIRKYDNRLICFSLMAIYIASIFPLFQGALPIGHDQAYHLNRIAGITSALKAGYFPVRISPGWFDGFGYGISIFYPDIFLYFPAILYAEGIPLHVTMLFYMSGISLLTIISSWFCFTKITNNIPLGILGSALYSLSAYRLACVYTRSAVGEYTAMIFYPLIMYGIYCIYTKSNNVQKKISEWFFLPLGMSGLLFCHILSTIITVILLTILFLLLWRISFKRLTIILLLKSALLTTALSLWIVIPFITMLPEITSGQLEWMWATPEKMQNNGLSIPDLFSFFANRNLPISIGWSSLFGSILYFWLKFIKREKFDNERPSTLTFYLFLLCLLMCTKVFPWSMFSGDSASLSKIIGNIQFPWRFLGVTTILGVLLTLWCINNNFTPFKRKSWYFLILLTLLFNTASYYDLSVRNMRLSENEDRSTPGSITMPNTEYSPKKNHVNIQKKDLRFSEGIQVTSWTQKDLSVTISCENGDSRGHIRVPRYFYTGYHCKVKDSNLELKTKSFFGRLTIEIPSHFKGTVTIDFIAPILWRVSEIISLISMVFVTLISIRKKIFSLNLKNIKNSLA